MYHLIDRKLEKKLIGLDPHFLEKLYDAMYYAYVGEEREVDLEIDAKPFKITGKLSLERDHVELIPDYNPKDWNNFPEVTPPKNTLMRLECTMENGEKYIGSAWVDKIGCWMIPLQNTDDFPIVEFNGADWVPTKVKEGRYRAWE